MPRNTRPSKPGIDLGSLTGKIPYDVERAIEILRENLEISLDRIDQVAGRLATMPPALSMDQIRAALAATGGLPLATAGLLNTNAPPTSAPPPTNNPPGTITADAYAAVAPDGTRVTVTAIEAGGAATVQFGSATPIAVPSHGTYPMAMSVGGDVFCIIKGSDGQAYLIQDDGTVTLLGPCVGIYSVGLRTDGTPVWQDTPTTYMVGGVSNPIPPAFSGTSMGFLVLDGSGDPVWTDDQIANPVIIDGITIALASRNGDWTAGRATSGSQFVAYNHSTAEMFSAGATNGSPITARPMDIAGGVVLAVSIPAGFLTEANFSPFDTSDPGAIDINTIRWLNADISGWAQTQSITSVSVTPSQICLFYTGVSVWPVDVENCQGNPWIVGFHQGQWMASTYEYFTQGQQCKNLSLPADFAQLLMRPLRDKVWVTGEKVGYIVSGRARDGMRTVQERTQIFESTWPL